MIKTSGLLPLSECYVRDKIKENMMGRACSTYNRQESCIQGFYGETGRNETALKSERR